MSWKTILSDKAKFGDDHTVEINGTKVTLGDLRQLNSASEGDLAKRMDEVSKKEKSVAQRESDAVTLLQQLQTTPPKTAAAAPAAGAAATFDPFNDPAWEPIMKPIAKQFEELRTGLGEVAQLKKSLTDIAATYIRDKWRSSYEGLSSQMLDEKTKQPRYKLEDLVQKAQAEKIVDPYTGIYDIRGAFDRLEEPRRLEEMRKKSFDEGIERGRQEALASAAGRPASSGFSASQFGGTQAAPNGKAKAISFDEALQQAAQDPDILSMLQQGA